MSIYLGDEKVGVNLFTIVDSANATPDMDTSAIVQQNPFDLPADRWQDSEIEEWTRPSDWPNLDNLPELTEGVYLTYRNRNDDNTLVDYPWASFCCATNGNYTIAIGHMNGNNWVQDSTQNAGNGAYVEINYGNLNLSYKYLIFKITPTTSSIHFTRFGFARVAAATLGTYALRQWYDQYCLERKGNLPYINTTTYSNNNYGYCTEWMECDDTSIGSMNTGTMSLYAAFFWGRNLKKINFDNWPTSQWDVTNISAMFEYCSTIQKLDLNNWNTSNWHVTNIYNIFDGCMSLKELKISNWDLTNWGSGTNKTLSFAGLFNNCRNLEELDLSKWDVSALRVTALNSIWSGCYRLRKLKINTWDTSNWRVTTMYCTFYYCYQLVEVDLSNWDVSDWPLTRIDSCWTNNRLRTNFKDIENWDTSNWVINQFNNVWDTCSRLNSLDLSHWDVSNWRVTTLLSTWSNCLSLKQLKIASWNTTQWIVSDLRNIFNNCNNLQNFDIFELNASNWPVTRIGSAFYGCYYLKEADLKTWSGNTTWTLTSDMAFNYVFGYCYNLKKIDVSNINVQNVTLTNYGSNKTSYTSFMECYSLKELKLPQNYKGHINLRYCYHLTRETILDIFDQMGTALSGAEIVLTEMRYKLTNSDIAVATAKGYTVT